LSKEEGGRRRREQGWSRSPLRVDQRKEPCGLTITTLPGTHHIPLEAVGVVDAAAGMTTTTAAPTHDVFWVRVLQNWKGKEKGSLSLVKGMTVKVLSASDDGEKYFGEAGKKTGWFPQIYVKREGSPLVKALPANLRPGHHTHARSKSFDPHAEAFAAASLPATTKDPLDCQELLETPSPSACPQGGNGGEKVLKRSTTVEIARPNNGQMGGDGKPENAGGNDAAVGLDSLTDEQNAAIMRVKKNRTLPHSRPPMPGLQPFSTPNMTTPQQQTSARPSARPGGLGLAVGPTSLSLNSIPMNPSGRPVSSPASPRSALTSSIYLASNSQPSSPITIHPSPPVVLSHSADSSAVAVLSSAPSALPSPNWRRNSSTSNKGDKKKKKLDGGTKQKPHSKRAGKQSSPTTQVFGVSLVEIMQKQRLDHPRLQVPIVLLNCAHAVLLLDGHKTEGIFRISGNAQSLDLLKDEIAECEYVDDFENVHNASSLLKLWLSSLASPLVPPNMAKQCTESIDNPQQSVQVLNEMPEVHKKTLSFVVQFLQQFIVPEKSVTKMDEDNLAMTLAPVIFGHNSGTGDMAMLLQQNQLQKVFLVNLIQHMKFEHSISWNEFEEAVEIINIKAAASQKMAMEQKRKKGGISGGLIGGIVKPFGQDKLRDANQISNTYSSSRALMSSPRGPTAAVGDDLSSGGSYVDESGDDEKGGHTTAADEEKEYEYG